jgi:hypothetical protein
VNIVRFREIEYTKEAVGGLVYSNLHCLLTAPVRAVVEDSVLDLMLIVKEFIG